MVSYIYFTRIAVFLLGATLPFQLVRAPALFSLVPSLSCASHPPVHTHPSPAYTSAICMQAWLRDFFSEGATVLFYCITGFKFRPGAENPYIQVKGDDDYGLAEQRDHSVELSEMEMQATVAEPKR